MEFENVLKVLSKYNNTYFYVHDFSPLGYQIC